MITENILKDFELYVDWGKGVNSKIYGFELQHKVIPIHFKNHLEVLDSTNLKKDDYYNTINLLYQEVIKCALHGKPGLPTTAWHTINYIPYWCKEKQCWCCLGRDGKEMFDEESVKMNNVWDELNM